MILLIFFAFVSGLATIFAPCIWPLLPIILSSSANGGHKKAIGITIGVIISFTIFTLSVSYLVMLFHFDPNILRLIAALAITFLGFTLIIPSLLIHYELLIGRVSSFIGGQSLSKHHGFIGGVITGLSLGIIWSPCAGPILATIATVASTQTVNLGTILVTLAFAIGVGIPLLLFSLAGAFLFKKSKFISKYTNHLQKGFGVIMILTALAIYTNFDKVIQSKLLNYFPTLTNLEANIENNPAVSEQLKILKGEQNSIPKFKINNSALSNLGPAPEFTGITNWINLPVAGLPAGQSSQVLTMQDLKGKVVLVDFWTYTCINCVRTLPHVTAWYKKYKDLGFVVIGVHTPEFEFEKNTKNVQNAIKQFNINYPVAQDNNYLTWNAYSNQYWPAKYLIDRKGNVRYTHFGEGEYDKTEKAIQELLKEDGNKVPSDIVDMPDNTPKTALSPETYLGTERMQYFYPGGNTGNITKNFILSKNIPINSFSLEGNWVIAGKQATTGKMAVLEYNFSANKVFLVLRPGVSKNPKIKVFLDGQLVSGEVAGADVKGGTVNIDTDRLYNLIDLKGKTENHLLRLEFQSEGIESYAFTFG